MATPSTHIESPERNLTPAAHPIRVRGRSAAALATGPAGGVGAVRILRRWSVAGLIARAGGVPRAFA